MCQIRIIYYSCGHSKKFLRGAACSQARFHEHSDGVLYFCPNATIDKVHIPSDCRRQSVLIACQVFPHLDAAQRRVLTICDTRVREVQNYALHTTRRILVALAKWSGGQTFRPNSYPLGKQPMWVGSLLGDYWGHTHMMDAAYFAMEYAHRALSIVVETCQRHILNGYTFIPNRAQILAFPHMAQGLADTILMPNMGWMIIARDYGRGQAVAGVGHPLTLTIRNAPQTSELQHSQLTGNQNVQLSTGQSAPPTNTQPFQATSDGITQTTFHEIDEMIEMISRQHLGN
ncbi:hypothetical protein P171DRAFT_483347 [Karstenula rhodostoma CBS 690.94]|uniref:Uncharacterized protein n=1 Tax=Karstenula rhodostoma CBS 690.94 TaxID=1392251 RepID=A0A9P4PN80_9PLEO|nr:hypothetical protein P171DRAFT_483347 [Karstenula rhodostoma CBS 690.94]